MKNMTRTRMGAGSLILVLLAGASAPARAQESVVASADESAVSPARAYWAALEDTTLSRLLAEALAGNLDLRAAEAGVDAASAARLEGALDLAPVVTASGSFTRQQLASSTFPTLGGNGFPDQNLWDARVNAAWELDVFGRLRNRLRARGALREASVENVLDAQVSVASQVARAYFDLRGTQGQLGVARRNAENQRRTLELTQQRLDAGQGNAFDVERAAAQLNLTLAAIPTLEQRLADAQYRIAVLVGRSPQALAAEVGDEGDLPELPENVPVPDVEAVVANRPDVVRAEREWAAGRSFVGAARADYLPRLSLAGGVGYTATSLDAFGNTGTFAYSVGPVISWPLFDLGRVKARVDEARAEESEAEARYAQARLVAAEEFEAARVRYRTARARLQYLAEAAGASERAAALAVERYQGGIADFFEVLDAERTLLAAQDQLAQGRTLAADAYVDLYEAIGARWPER